MSQTFESQTESSDVKAPKAWSIAEIVNSQDKKSSSKDSTEDQFLDNTDEHPMMTSTQLQEISMVRHRLVWLQIHFPSHLSL